MSEKLPGILAELIDNDKKDPSNPGDTISTYLYHWPLFILSVLIFLGGAFAYLRTQKPAYSFSASVIINDEKKLPDDKEKLEEIDLNNTPKLAENEIGVFKSRNLVSKVVNDLDLWISYQKNGRLKTEDLYKRSPVIFRLLDQTGEIGGQVFNIIVKDDKSFFIKKSNDSLVLFQFGEPLKNSFGTWKLEPTQYLSLFKGTQISIGLSDPDKVAEAYQKNIDADLPNKLAPTIELTLKDEVKARGKDVLNDVIAFYNSITKEEKNQANQRTLDFINKRISDMATELNGYESAVEGFKSSKGLTNISSQSQVYLQNAQQNDQKLNEVNVQLQIINEIEKSVNSGNDDQEVPSTLGIINDPVLARSVDKLSELQLDKAKLLATTPASNPIFDPINRQIKNIKKTISDDVEGLKTSLQASKRQLLQYDSQFQSSLRSLPVQERQLVDKTRQQTIRDDLYVYLLHKKEQIALNYAATVPDARIVDYAYAASPSSKSMLIYAAAMLLGLMFPPGFIYLRRMSSNKITNRKEIEQGAETEIIGELSKVKGPVQISTRDASNIVIGEEFRSLRTNLYFLNKNSDKGTVILITSSISGEGKSFVSTNLASVLAVAGNKTAILEMDLRRPGISSIFGLSSSHKGISDYIIDNIPFEKIIQNSGVSPDLDVIGCGYPPSAPSELLGRVEIDVLVEALRSRYKYIIIDTPPLNLVTDAKILSRLSDISLYIIRQAYTYKSLLPFIRSLNKSKQFAELKIVFNGIEKERYGYGHNYGNDYYQRIGGKKARISMFNDFFKRF